MLVRPEQFFADRFGLSGSVTERLLGDALARRVRACLHRDLVCGIPESSRAPRPPGESASG